MNVRAVPIILVRTQGVAYIIWQGYGIQAVVAPVVRVPGERRSVRHDATGSVLDLTTLEVVHHEATLYLVVLFDFRCHAQGTSVEQHLASLCLTACHGVGLNEQQRAVAQRAIGLQHGTHMVLGNAIDNIAQQQVAAVAVIESRVTLAFRGPQVLVVPDTPGGGVVVVLQEHVVSVRAIDLQHLTVETVHIRKVTVLQQLFQLLLRRHGKHPAILAIPLAEDHVVRRTANIGDDRRQHMLAVAVPDVGRVVVFRELALHVERRPTGLHAVAHTEVDGVEGLHDRHLRRIDEGGVLHHAINLIERGKHATCEIILTRV